MTDVERAAVVIEALRAKPGVLFEVLRQGCPEVAGPWRLWAGGECHIRSSPKNEWVVWVRPEKSTGGVTWEYSVRGEPAIGGFIAKETAMGAADSVLRLEGVLLA